VTGGLLLFSYALGLALPLILFSTYMSRLDKNGKIWKIIRGKELQFYLGRKVVRVHTTSLISGLLFMAVGYLIFSGSLYVFNQYVGSSSFQKFIFSVEDNLLNFLR